MSAVVSLLLKLAATQKGRNLLGTVLLVISSLLILLCALPVILMAVPVLMLQAGSTDAATWEIARMAQQQIVRIEQWSYAAVHEDLDLWIEQTVASLVTEGIPETHIAINKPNDLRIKASEVVILWSAQHSDKEPDHRVHEIMMDFLERSVQRASMALEDGGSVHYATISIRLRSFDEVLLLRGLTEEQMRIARIMLAYQQSSNQLQGQTTWLGNDQTFNEGDIVLDGGAVSVRFFHQRDQRWANQSYAGENIAAAGCGPTAVAIAVSSLLDREVTPAEVARWSEENGYAAYNNGSYHSLIPAAAAHYGLAVTSGNDTTVLKAALAEGSLAIAIMGPGAFTPTGHFIVLRGTDEEGRILVADPVSLERSQRSWSCEQIVREAQKGSGSGGPIWLLNKE